MAFITVGTLVLEDRALQANHAYATEHVSFMGSNLVVEYLLYLEFKIGTFLPTKSSKIEKDRKGRQLDSFNLYTYNKSNVEQWLEDFQECKRDLKRISINRRDQW